MLIASLFVGMVPALALAQVAPPATEADGGEAGVLANRHGVGFSAAVYPLLGFTYRHYFAASALEVHLMPLLADSGNYLRIHMGLQYIDYLLIWSRTRSQSVISAPTTALRLVAAGGFSATRDQSTSIAVADANCRTKTCQSIINQVKTDYLATAGVGFGFEFGAVQTAGLSLAVDVMLTSMWDNQGFYALYPLPSATLMYNW